MLQFYKTIVKLAAHAQAVDTRLFSPPTWPGYEANFNLYSPLPSSWRRPQAQA